VRAAGWSIPVVIVLGLLVIGLRHGPEAAGDDVVFWILATGVPGLIGAVLALAHPVTVVATFLAAPLTALSPLIGVGHVAALVQAYVRPPLVREIQTVTDDVRIPSRWWTNRLLRICLVFVLTTIGTSMGTLVGTAEILRRLF
jgi:pheromone shutdown protein TraB